MARFSAAHAGLGRRKTIHLHEVTGGKVIVLDLWWCPMMVKPVKHHEELLIIHSQLEAHIK